MFYYNQLCNDSETNLILDNLNESLNRYYNNAYPVCHGRCHTMFTVDTVEHILKSLSFEERTIELGKIAALLHDIGNIAGRRNHDKKSAALARVIFDDSDYLTLEEKELICQAISDHSMGSSIESAVGAALIIADKVDFSIKRAIKLNNKSGLEKNKQLIKHVELLISGNEIIVFVITDDIFSKELFDRGYTRYNIIKKAVDFLGCSCAFQFNSLNDMFAL